MGGKRPHLVVLGIRQVALGAEARHDPGEHGRANLQHAKARNIGNTSAHWMLSGVGRRGQSTPLRVANLGAAAAATHGRMREGIERLGARGSCQLARRTWQREHGDRGRVGSGRACR